MNQVEADEQLRLSGRQAPDGVCVPHLLQERLAHNLMLSLEADY